MPSKSHDIIYMLYLNQLHMKADSASQKVMIGVGALVIILLGLLGEFLIRGEFALKDLILSAHNHGLCFAFSAVLIAFILTRVPRTPRSMQRMIAALVVISFTLPIGLYIGGIVGTHAHLKTTSWIGGLAFVIAWLLAALQFLMYYGKEKKEEKEEKKD